MACEAMQMTGEQIAARKAAIESLLDEVLKGVRGVDLAGKRVDGFEETAAKRAGFCQGCTVNALKAAAKARGIDLERVVGGRQVAKARRTTKARNDRRIKVRR